MESEVSRPGHAALSILRSKKPLCLVTHETQLSLLSDLRNTLHFSEVYFSPLRNENNNSAALLGWFCRFRDKMTIHCLAPTRYAANGTPQTDKCPQQGVLRQGGQAESFSRQEGGAGRTQSPSHRLSEWRPPARCSLLSQPWANWWTMVLMKRPCFLTKTSTQLPSLDTA